MNIRNTLSSNIKILMKRAGIHSQTRLAHITGVSQSQIGNILRCTKGVSTNILERLAQGLDCESWLLLAPTSFIEKHDHTEFAPLVHCYMRLDENAQDTIWKITHELYEASGKLQMYKP